MRSQMNIALECPYCHKPTGYHFTREGAIYHGEIVGRFAGNTLACVHCKQPIEIMVHFQFRKTNIRRKK